MMWLRFMVLALLGVTSVVQAGFQLVEVVQPVPVCDGVGVTLLSASVPANPRPMITRGTNVVASVALKRLVPHDWQVDVAVPEDATVSWTGGVPWESIVARIAEDKGWCVTLDHDRKRAFVAVGQTAPKPTMVDRPARPAPELPSVAAAAQATANAVAEEAEEARAVTPPTDAPEALLSDGPVVVDPPTTYELRAGDTLKSTLERWCADAGGWVLEWHVDYDYPIDAGFTYPPGTSFRDAVRETLRVYWHRRNPLMGRTYTNKVLYVAAR